MRPRSLACLLATVCLAPSLGGCGPKVQSFVMPDFETVRYEALQTPKQPTYVQVEARYLSNGRDDDGSAKLLRRNVIDVLKRSGVFVPSGDDKVKAKLIVVAENFYDPEAARSAGIKAGLSFGHNGQQVIDRYKFTVSFQNGLGGDRLGRYDHEFHTTIGKVEPPERAALVEPGEAFQTVVEDVMLKFLYDLKSTDTIEVPIMFVPDSNKKL